MADNNSMNKHINFEDNLFILNVRIRMIRDMLSLDADSGLFLGKTVEDLEFMDTVLENLTGNLIGNPRLLDRELEFDNLSDIEWQFVQLLIEFMNKSNPFIAGLGEELPPEIKDRISRLKERSAARRKTIEEVAIPWAEQPPMEPVVSPLELGELLKQF
jgi:hypothetical protein